MKKNIRIIIIVALILIIDSLVITFGSKIFNNSKEAAITKYSCNKTISSDKNSDVLFKIVILVDKNNAITSIDNKIEYTIKTDEGYSLITSNLDKKCDDTYKKNKKIVCDYNDENKKQTGSWAYQYVSTLEKDGFNCISE